MMHFLLFYFNFWFQLAISSQRWKFIGMVQFSNEYIFSHCAFAAPEPSSDTQSNGDDALEEGSVEKKAPAEKPEIISWRRKADDDDGDGPRRSSDDSSRKRYSPDRRRRSNGMHH